MPPSPAGARSRPCTLPRLCAENVWSHLQLPALLRMPVQASHHSPAWAAYISRPLWCRYHSPPSSSSVPYEAEDHTALLDCPTTFLAYLCRLLARLAPKLSLGWTQVGMLRCGLFRSSLLSSAYDAHAGPLPVCLPSPLSKLKSRPGPNSRGLLSLHMRTLILILCVQPSCAGLWTEASGQKRGLQPTPPRLREVQITSDLLASAPKPGGFPTKNRPMLNVYYTRSAKRAYQRACNRAVQQGQTRYRGRLLTSAQIPAARRGTQPVSTSNIPARKLSHPNTGGVQLFTWNSGGLGGRSVR